MRPQHWWYTVPLRVRSLFRRDRADEELDEELRFHLEMKIEEGIAQGLSQGEARYRARLALGGVEQRKEEMRDARRVGWLTDSLDDLRHAVRSLRRTPALTAVVVITIALGIGMTEPPFLMLDAFVFRPYPVPSPRDVVTLMSTSQDRRFEGFSHREYRDIRAGARSYDGVAASTQLAPIGFSADPGATPRVRGGMMVSGNYFRVLGVEPSIGRGFRDEEDEVPGRDAVAVLGPDFWRRELAGDPAVVGRRIRLNGSDFTVIGVAPEKFVGMTIFGRPDVYVPLAMARAFSTDPRKSFFTDRDDRELTVRARMKRGVSLAEARGELALLARGFERAYPAESRGRSASVRTQLETRTPADDGNWKFGVIFMGLALAVLLVACTNAAGLLLSRASTRTREIAVRLALGSGRFRLIRLLLTESLVLAGLGGLLGIAAGYVAVALTAGLRLPTELPVELPFRMDGRVLVASLAVSVLSALACGLAPALQSTRTDLVSGLKATDADEPGRKRFRGRHALIVAQVAISPMLLTAAALMYRGFHQTVAGGVGFPKDHLLMVRLDPRLVQYDADRTRHFYELLIARAQGTPGVQAAALLRHPPLAPAAVEAVAFVPEGYELPADREHVTSGMDTVDPGYFRTMGIPILRGRGFAPSDGADAPRVAVVNERLATRYFPGGDAVGKRIRLESRTGPPVEIVGVARDIKYRVMLERDVDFLYLPLAQRPASKMVLMLRSSGDPLSLVEPVKDVVRKLDPNMPILETRSYEDLYRYAAVDGPQGAVRLVGAMGLVGLLLTVAGLYGVVSYNVSRRTREIGIRMAIGARSPDVLRLVMGKGLRLVGLGTAIGLALGLAIERVMNSALFAVAGVDLTVYLVVLPAMVVLTLLAAYVPARRATRIAPTRALRYE